MLFSQVSFPRATRGWKDWFQDAGVDVWVSPALRGDGRRSQAAPMSVSLFPPRYAGMEEHVG